MLRYRDEVEVYGSKTKRASIYTITCYPVLKSFTALRSLGRQSERLTNDYITYASTVRRIRQKLWFYHRCEDHGLVPA